MNTSERGPAHPERWEMLAWMDGELTPERSARFERHVAACATCREALAELRRSARAVGEALRFLDAAPPRGEPARIRRRAFRRPLVRALPAAAVLVLLLAGAALALVPGSPLRSWLSGGSPEPDDPAPGERAAGTVSRLSVRAPDRLDVVFDRPRDSLDLEVVRSAGGQLEVATRVGEALARLEFGDAAVRVGPGDATLVRLVVPRHVRARIVVEGEVVATLEPGAGAEGAAGAPGDSVAVLRIGPRGPGGS